jgi:hypothetical protein
MHELTRHSAPAMIEVSVSKSNNRTSSGGPAMSLFGNILQKLGFNRPAAAAAPAPQAAPTPQAPPPAQSAPATPAAPAAITVVDVVAKLEGLAAKNPQKLNWRVSIVDLLKLLDLDSSFGTRKELATELGCPADKMGDSAQMNMWLHKTVLQKLADNGGNIPKELLS